MSRKRKKHKRTSVSAGAAPRETAMQTGNDGLGLPEQAVSDVTLPDEPETVQPTDTGADVAASQEMQPEPAASEPQGRPGEATPETQPDEAAQEAEPDEATQGKEPDETAPELPPEPKRLRFWGAPRKKKKHLGFFTFVGFTAVFALASAAFVFLLFNFSGSTLFVTPEEVDLPNFFGMDISDVKSNPEYSKFSFIIEEQYNPEYDEGIIFAQSPKAPKSVKENAVITLRVSKGVQNVEVPSVDGMTAEEAKTLLEESGLSVVVRYVSDDEVDDDFAIRTEPEAGEKEVGGNTVTLYVSREDNYVHVTVPDCVGKTESEASQILKNAGFSVSVVEKESNKAAGTVVAMAPSGTAVQGSNITITVSKGTLVLDGGDHMHELVAVQTIPPTATGYGYTVYVCNICGFSTYGNQIPPTG